MPILTQKDFSQWIEFNRVSNPDKSYLDIIQEACDNFEVDYEEVRPLLTEQIINKLEAEAISANLLREKVKSYNLDCFF